MVPVFDVEPLAGADGGQPGPGDRRDPVGVVLREQFWDFKTHRGPRIHVLVKIHGLDLVARELITELVQRTPQGRPQFG